MMEEDAREGEQSEGLWDGKGDELEEEKSGGQLHALQDRKRQYAKMAKDPRPRIGRCYM